MPRDHNLFALQSAVDQLGKRVFCGGNTVGGHIELSSEYGYRYSHIRGLRPEAV
jgi:hypothetical protein